MRSDVTPRVPDPIGLHAEFYRHARSGRLHLQRCTRCEAFQHPPRHCCPRCGSSSWTWEPIGGEGTLYSWTVTHVPFDRGWAPAVPYVTAVIELSEGVRLIGSLEVTDVGLLRIGSPLEVFPLPLGDEFALLELRPTGG